MIGGDIVVFKSHNLRNDKLIIGEIISYYEENGCIWYDIRINNNYIYSFGNGGDIGEHDIIAKITDENIINYFKNKFASISKDDD